VPRPRRRKGSHLGAPLRIRELAEFDLHASRDCGHFIAGLKAREIWSVFPRPGTTQFYAGLDGGVMHDVDLALVIRVALPVAGKIPEVAARGKNRVHSRNLGDLIGVLEALEGLDHEDQDHIVVDRIAITTWDITPHV